MSGAPTPSRRQRPALLPVTLYSALLLVGCFASPVPSTPTDIGSRGSTAPSATSRSSSPPSPSPSADQPPPLNRLELKVIDALARVGVTGRRAQLPYQDAAISADLRTGTLFVHALPSMTRVGEFKVVGERQIEGRRVQIVQYGNAPSRHQFECAGDTYGVWGAVPPASQDMDAFVAGLIRALGCGA